jgi:acetoacetyl-CoA synthetase
MANMELWKHPNVQSTRVDAFRRYINRKYNLSLMTYADLHTWSIDDIEVFGKEIWIFCGMVSSAEPTKIGIGLDKIYPRPTWFPGARLNYTENLLSVGLASHANAVAVSSIREGGFDRRDLTWLQLRDQVEKWTSALKRARVRKGDRVASKALA